MKVDLDWAKQEGFESNEEFHRMVASVDLSTPEKIAAFKEWQRADGKKPGLEKLLNRGNSVEHSDQEPHGS